MFDTSVLRICTYNCRSVKKSLPEVRRLCDSHDIVCIQEHWLLPSELDYLSNIHNDFYSVGSSAVDVTSDILVGRPYGGTAILYRKSLCNLVSILPTTNSCVTGLKLLTVVGPLMLLTVYMPTEYNDDDSLEKYTEACAYLDAILTDCDTPHAVIAGDFNCQPGSRFFDILSHLILDNSLIISDMATLSGTNDVFTYCSDSGSNTSWIDHIVCSNTINNALSDVAVLLDFICSDHRPLTAKLNCAVTMPVLTVDDDNVNGKQTRTVHNWSRVDDFVANMYDEALFNNLSHISIPDAVRNCCVSQCNNAQHTCAIDIYYHAIIDCVNRSIEGSIPVKTVPNNQFNVAGWNDFVQEKYDTSRAAFLEWVYCGRPRTGAVFTRMSRSRASFKLALRYCKQHEDQLRADACARSLNLHNSKSFWNNVKKVNCNAATKYASSVGGVCGDKNIASLWRDHFNNLYNSVANDGSKDEFFARLRSSQCTPLCCNVTVQEIRAAISRQKRGKAAGPDGIAMEAFIFGNTKLLIHLSLLFNMFIMHSHITPAFMQTVIVPLVKAKCGDLTDVNNYRAIALSNSITKILESVFMSKVTAINDGDCYQFGFKAGHSTGLCTNTMKKVIDYYTSRDSHVFVCFVDFSKAFDKVDYWKLFSKLLDDNINHNVVALLAVWYSKQQACVRWKQINSSPFNIGNGTRQGGLLSPYLFSRYIRELLMAIVQSNIGCNIGGVPYNILAYADDIILMAPSWRALQSLIDLLSHCAIEISMSCNVTKTVCMIFNPKRKRMIIDSSFPCFTLEGLALQTVSEFKYLGHMINNDFSDDDDIKREIRNLFMRTNILIRRYSKCSLAVKLTLFRAYCMCLYDAGIWLYYSITVFNKLKSCYNKCIKMFFGYNRRYSVTLMLSELNLPSFDNLYGNCVDSFYSSCFANANTLITNLISLQLITSPATVLSG